MAKESSKQKLANLIQSYEQAVKSAQSLYDDDDLKQWAIEHSLACQEKIKDVKKKLKDTFSIDYDATEAKKKVIKEGSEVEVLVNHMDGMKGGTATIKSYSLPANISDITMKDGMKMKDVNGKQEYIISSMLNEIYCSYSVISWSIRTCSKR